MKSKPLFSVWYLQRAELWDKLVGQGYSYQEIADRTGDVSARQVKSVLETYRKMQDSMSIKTSQNDTSKGN
jgi:transposase